jgi:hypothetical protein
MGPPFGSYSHQRQAGQGYDLHGLSAVPVSAMISRTAGSCQGQCQPVPPMRRSTSRPLSWYLCWVTSHTHLAWTETGGTGEHAHQTPWPTVHGH